MTADKYAEQSLMNSVYRVFRFSSKRLFVLEIRCKVSLVMEILNWLYYTVERLKLHINCNRSVLKTGFKLGPNRSDFSLQEN